MKKEEMMLKATQMLAKGKFKLKKAGPTIMIVGAAIGGVTAAVLACKATLKAEEIIAEHNAQIETIHTTKAQVDSGEMQLKDGETYTADDMKKDITATYKMATKAVEAISEYGDFDSFASDDAGLPPWQKPDIPWDDVQDEAAQNFDVR